MCSVVTMNEHKTISEICKIADISRTAFYKRLKSYESDNGAITQQYTSGGIRIFTDEISEILINPVRKKPGRKKG